jgi:hypothetical protein
MKCGQQPCLPDVLQLATDLTSTFNANTVVVNNVSSLFYLFTSILAFPLSWTFAFLQHRLASLDYTCIASLCCIAPLSALRGAFFLGYDRACVLLRLGPVAVAKQDCEIGISIDLDGITQRFLRPVITWHRWTLALLMIIIVRVSKDDSRQCMSVVAAFRS